MPCVGRNAPAAGYSVRAAQTQQPLARHFGSGHYGGIEMRLLLHPRVGRPHTAFTSGHLTVCASATRPDTQLPPNVGC